MSIKYPYKAFPLIQPDPISKTMVAWRPALPVILFCNHKRSLPIESIVDTGSDQCIFHGQIGDSLGINVKSGMEYSFGGVAQGMQAKGYAHRVRLQVAGESYETHAVFSYEISIGGILGQVGFFDHFVATFDWIPNPPCFELQRIERN